VAGNGGGWSFSPEGTRIAFALNQNGRQGEIYVVNVDGTGLRHLGGVPGMALEPRWSPDSRQIVFEGWAQPYDSNPFASPDLYLANVDGSGQGQLTTDGSTPWSGHEGSIGLNEDPSWSPDGSRILFVHEYFPDDKPGGGQHLYTVRPDGTGLTRITKGSGFDSQPDWSPDGSRIAFSHYTGGDGVQYIAVAKANGSNVRRLTNPDGYGDTEPSWSPDGKQLAFTRSFGSPDYCHAVFRINADGSGETELPSDYASDPHWQSLPAGRPANDSFLLPETLTGATGSIGGSNVGATKEPGEPNPARNRGGASIWYRWQAPGTGPVTVDTHGSSFDTLLGVYTGTTVDALMQLAANNDSGGGDLTSSVTFQARAGVVYRILVDGRRDSSGNVAQGSVVVRWNGPAAQVPPNDDLSNAQVLTGMTGQASGWNLGATAESGEHVQLDHPGASVWYRWTAPATGTATFDTAGSGYDTTLWVYTGSASQSKLKVAWDSDDGYPTGVASRIAGVHVDAGKTYSLSVDGYRTPSGITQGDFTLDWAESTP